LTQENCGHHRVIDPDVYGAELALDRFSRSLDPVGVGHIRRQRQGLAAQSFNVTPRAFQPVAPAR